jgi:hypothetical protein
MECEWLVLGRFHEDRTRFETLRISSSKQNWCFCVLGNRISALMAEHIQCIISIQHYILSLLLYIWFMPLRWRIAIGTCLVIVVSINDTPSKHLSLLLYMVSAIKYIASTTISCRRHPRVLVRCPFFSRPLPHALPHLLLRQHILLHLLSR